TTAERRTWPVQVEGRRPAIRNPIFCRKWQKTAGTPLIGTKIDTGATRQNPILGWTVAGTGWAPAGVEPVSTTLELAMRMVSSVTTCALLLSATQAFAAASSTRIAETGAYLLGNAHRCGV